MSSANSSFRTGFQFARRNSPLALVGVLATTLTLLAAFDSHRVVGLVNNTLWLATGACLIAVPFGTLLAMLVSKTNAAGGRLLTLVMAGMLFVPLYFQAAAWDAGFGMRGWFAFSDLGLARPLLESWRAAIWVHGVAAVPWVMLIVAAGLHDMESELEEEALLDGSPTQVVWRVTLPRVSGAICVGALWTFIVVGTEMCVSDLYRVRTCAEEIYLHETEELSGSAAGVFVTIAVVGLLVLAAFAIADRFAPALHSASLAKPRRWRLGRRGQIASAFAVVVGLALVAVPLGNLLYKAGMSVVTLDGQTAQRWSAAKLADVLIRTPTRFSDEFCWSLLIGLTTASLVLLIAVPLAWLGRRGIGSVITLLVTACGLAIPGPLLGILIIRLMNWPGATLLHALYDRSIAAPVLATTIRALPIGILILWFGLRSVGADQLDSSATEGAGIWRRLLFIVLAQRRSVLASAWIVAFAIAFGELSASVLVTPPGVDILPRRVFGLVHAGVDDQVAGICLCCVGLYGVVGAIVYGVFRKALFRNRDHAQTSVGKPEGNHL